ncbi:condensation domain-containing protein, partial [Microbulbifer litoralis]|uniref:condensation domain-containing protein n=1 Tax=Microbulbifer litoralis TaxID=2933965 RepID=UPI0020288495
LKSLFELPSIEEQAGLIEAQKAVITEATEIAAPRQPAIHPIDHDGPVALSHAQNGLWLLNQMEGASGSYIAGTSLDIDGAIDAVAVEKAFSAIVERHRILRTVIREYEAGPMQVVIDASAFHVQVTDLSDIANADAERELLVLTHQAKSRRFDLSKDVMLRVHLVKRADQRHTLLVHMHHIVCDGWSIGLLMKEFNILYRMYTEDSNGLLTQASLPVLSIQYRDYAQWQRQLLSGTYLDELVGYWRERLDGIPTLHALPTDHPRPEQPSYRGAVYRHRIAAEITDTFRHHCQAQGATFFMGMHAAFSAWLARYSGCDDIVLGTAIANREQTEVAPLIGFFSNSIVLRNRIGGRDTFTTCLDRTRRQDITDFDHQQLPFELLAEKLNPERSLRHNPIFQIVLNLDNNEVEPIHLSDSEVRGQEQLSYESNFDLTLYAVEQASGTKLIWRYATD